MRILFLGTGDIAIPSFDAIANAPQHELVGLVTQPDRPAGRRRELKAPAIKKRAGELGLPVLQPEKIRRPAALEEIRNLSPDVGVVMAYGQILPKAVLEFPRYGCLNLHASLLPRHRGAAPIQAAILEGDRETGVTVMYMDEGLDTGDIMLMEALEIGAAETGGELHDRLGLLAGTMIVEALDQLEAGSAPRVSQNEARATYAPKIGREDGRIDWASSATAIARMIRAYHPWPGASATFQTDTGARRVAKILRAEPLAAATLNDAPPGSRRPESRYLEIQCGEGALRILELQPEGKRPMAVADFLRGTQVERAVVC